MLRNIGLVAVALLGCGNVNESNPDAPPGGSDAATCVVASASTRARWRGESNASDDTGALPGTIVGGLSFTAGKHGMAFLFDGVDDAITADPDDQLWAVGSFSLEAWVKGTTAPADFAGILQKFDGAGADAAGLPNWQVAVNAMGYPAFTVRSTTNNNATVTASTASILDGAFHHLVAVRDVDAKRITLFVDGVVGATSAPGDAFFTSMTSDDGRPDPVMIGATRQFGGDGFFFFFSGAIDEPAYYDAALSAADVTTIFTAPDGVCR